MIVNMVIDDGKFPSGQIEYLCEEYVEIIRKEGRVKWNNLSGYYIKGILIDLLSVYIRKYQ